MKEPTTTEPKSKATAARREAARQWYEENKQAVDAYNKMIQTHGLFSDGVRMF